MTDIRPDRMDETEPSDDELVALEQAGFEPAKGFHDFGVFDLVTALRVGYKLGRQDAAPREYVEIRRGSHESPLRIDPT